MSPEPRYAYRGVSDKNYKLETSLMRQRGDYKSTEHHILKQFKKYAYNDVSSSQDDWYWLSLGQHYGLPTRLMDWSYSPDVALHFATVNSSKMNVDGAVWKLNYKKIHEKAPQSIRKIMEEEKNWLPTSEMMSEAFENFKAFELKCKDYNDFIVFFEPPSLDSRIYNQYAYFSVSSRSDLLIDDYIKENPDVWYKIIILSEMKWEVRDKLDQRNISERVLFPGLGGLAQWIARYYLPTTPSQTSGATTSLGPMDDDEPIDLKIVP